MAVSGTIKHNNHNRRAESTGRGHDADDARRRSTDSDAIELGALEAEPFLASSDGATARDDDDDANGAPSYPKGVRKKPRVIWLTAFFLMYSLAYGIALVPRINLIVSLVCRETLSSPAAVASVVAGGYNPQCKVDEVSSRTAMVHSAGSIVSGILSMGMSAYLNALGDRVGRVKIMAYSGTVLLCVEVVMVSLARAPPGTSWKWLFVAFALDGLSGSFTVAMAMSSAYISDCVDEEKRNVEVGRIHGAMFVGIAAGPAMSSVIVARSGKTTPLLVFYIGITMRVLALVYLVTCVAESLPQARKGFRGVFTSPGTRWQTSKPGRRVDAILFKLSKINPAKWLDRLVPPGLPGSRRTRRNVILLLAINICCYAGAMSTGEVMILYPQVVFKWGNVENNMFISVVNAFRAIVSTLGIPILIFLFQRRKPQYTPIPNFPVNNHDAAATRPSTHTDRTTTTNDTDPETLLDPSSFPDIDSINTPTTPTNTTSPFLDSENRPPLSPPPGPSYALRALDPLDRTLILTAILFDIFGYIGYAAAPNGVLFTLCGAAAAFGAVGLSTSEAALTKCVQPTNPNAAANGSGGRGGAAAPAGDHGECGGGSRVGELMAGLGLLQSVVRIVAPALVNVVYGATVAVGWPGMVFWGMAGLLGVGVALTLCLAVG